jgi:hypothetical protein
MMMWVHVSQSGLLIPRRLQASVRNPKLTYLLAFSLSSDRRKRTFSGVAENLELAGRITCDGTT